MRMKDVLARTGLTDRAVRLYIENGLLSPRQESNYAGRKSIDFSEEDVETLEVIATLRKSGFSLRYSPDAGRSFVCEGGAGRTPARTDGGDRTEEADFAKAVCYSPRYTRELSDDR